MRLNYQYILTVLILGLSSLPVLAAKDSEINEQFFKDYSKAVKTEKQGDRLQAVIGFKAAHELKHRDLGALVKLGLMHLYSDGEGEIRTKAIQNSIEYLNKAHDIKPGDPMVNLLLGKAYQAQGDVDKAIKYLIKASNLEPGNVLLKESLGQLYFEQKEFKNAIEIFNKIILSYPDNLRARSYIGAALQSTDNYLAAIEQYNYVLSYEPNAYSIRKNLGDCWLALEQYDKAKESYELAQKIDPKVPNIYADIAFVAKQESDYTAAIDNYRKALEIKQDDNWKRALAHTLWDDKQLPEAIQVFDEIDEHRISGYLHQSLGDPKSATLSYQKAIELNPKDNKSRFNLARIYHETQEYDKAKVEYEKLLELKPNDIEVIFLLAVLEHESGNVEHAMKYYNELIEEHLATKPSEELDGGAKLIKNNVHYNLGLAYKSKQNYEKAEANFEELLKDKETTKKLDKSRDVYKELSFIKIALDKDSEAEKLINSWLREDPTNVEARNLYADFLVHLSKERKAIEQLRLASVLDETVRTRLKLANLLHSQSNLYEALAEYQLVLQAEPSNLNALLGAANNFKSLGFKEEAINIYDQTIHMHPDDVLANYNYGLLMQETENLDKALKHYEKVLELNPSFLQTYYVLGLVYWDLDNKDKAKEVWDSFLSSSSDERLKGEIRKYLESPEDAKIDHEAVDLLVPEAVEELSSDKDHQGLEDKS